MCLVLRLILIVNFLLFDLGFDLDELFVSDLFNVLGCLSDCVVD